jgi:hypothetical protein
MPARAAKGGSEQKSQKRKMIDFWFELVYN